MAILGGMYKGKSFGDFVGCLDEALQIRLNRIQRTEWERISVNQDWMKGEDVKIYDSCSIKWVYSNSRNLGCTEKQMGEIWVRNPDKKVVTLERTTGITPCFGQYESERWYIPEELTKAVEIYRDVDKFLIERFGNPVGEHHDNPVFRTDLAEGLKRLREVGVKTLVNKTPAISAAMYG